VRKTRLDGAWLRNLWATLAGSPEPVATGVGLNAASWIGIAPDEDLIAFFEQYPAPLAADASDLPRSGTEYLAASRMSLVVPLVTQRRLVGLLGLGEPASGGPYSADDRAFLTVLADQAASAVRIVQLLDHPSAC
jgi:GAF domain-containing protein